MQLIDYKSDKLLYKNQIEHIKKLNLKCSYQNGNLKK